MDQNIPNPYSDATIIGYYIPATATDAYMAFYNVNGVMVHKEVINHTGEGSLKVENITLSAGAYFYSLVIDGNLIGSKAMIKTN